MSLKPLKKTDMNKSWMKKRRDKQIKIQPEYHLIVTEGTKTEPEYFRAIRDIINHQYKDRVQLDIYGEGENTLNLFDRAQKHANNSPNIYKHVWIVYNDSAQKTPAGRKNVRGMNAPITNNATIIPTGFSSGIVGFSWPDVLQNAVIRCIALLFQEKHFR